MFTKSWASEGTGSCGGRAAVRINAGANVPIGQQRRSKMKNLRPSKRRSNFGGNPVQDRALAAAVGSQDDDPEARRSEYSINDTCQFAQPSRPWDRSRMVHPPPQARKPRADLRPVTAGSGAGDQLNL